MTGNIASGLPVAVESDAPIEIATLAKALNQSFLDRTINEQRQRVLFETTSGLIDAHDLDELPDIVFRTIGAAIDADLCFNYRLDAFSQKLTLVYSAGLEPALKSQFQEILLGQGSCGTVAKTLTPLVLDAAQIAADANAASIRDIGATAYCCHALRARDGRVLGTFSVASTKKLRFEPGEVVLLASISNVLAQAAERIGTEAALRLAHDSFRHLVEQSPFGIYAVDADFRLAQVSQGAQKVFASVSPLIGRDLEEVLRILWPEPFVSEALGHFRHTLKTGETYHSPKTVEQRADIGTTEAYDWKIERVRMPDGRDGVVCHFYDLSERQQHEAEMQAAHDRQQILMRELAHRGKNLATVVQSIARRTFDGRRTSADALEVFSGRLQALARSYSTLTGEMADTVSLADVVETELTGFGPRAKIDGPAVTLRAKDAQMVALVVHELATNAAKHGALSNAHGVVEVRWTVERQDGELWLAFEWLEDGGPPVNTPTRKGFGSVLVGQIAASQLGCEPELSFAASGLRYRFRAPFSALGLRQV